MVVPGSGLVKEQAVREGLDKILIEAGFDWREPGCSMCLAMNPDKLAPGERCASTSNRNFEGRQGNGGRTHLVSPQMAAAAAIKANILKKAVYRAVTGPSSGKYTRELTFQNFLQGTLTDIRTFGIPNVVVPTEDTLPKSGYSSVVRKPGKILVQIFIYFLNRSVSQCGKKCDWSAE